jgi:uncharacterized integral membrane protein
MADRSTADRDTAQYFEESEKRGISARVGAGIAALAVLVLFLLQNLQQVDVNFLWFSASIRLIWALLLAAAFGGVATIALGFFTRRKEQAKAGR